MHANADCGLMHVRLHEDVTKHARITINHDYPVMVEGRHPMSPTPIPTFDNPRLHRMPALQLFDSGTQKRIYGIPPYSQVESIDFEDHPFRIQEFSQPCALCGGTGVYR